jgi:hypothetical protein
MVIWKLSCILPLNQTSQIGELRGDPTYLSISADTSQYLLAEKVTSGQRTKLLILCHLIKVWPHGSLIHIRRKLQRFCARQFPHDPGISTHEFDENSGSITSSLHSKLFPLQSPDREEIAF